MRIEYVRLLIDRAHWWVLMNMIMNLQLPRNFSRFPGPDGDCKLLKKVSTRIVKFYPIRGQHIIVHKCCICHSALPIKNAMEMQSYIQSQNMNEIPLAIIAII
jgi:hypothetical protein